MNSTLATSTLGRDLETLPDSFGRAFFGEMTTTTGKS